METISQQTAGPNRALDLGELRERCLGRMDLVERVLKDFERLLDGQVQELEAAVAAGDWLKTRALSHRLKGASLTVSAHDLGRCAHQLERLSEGAGAGAGELERCLVELRTQCSRVTEEVKRVRPGKVN